MSETFWFIDKTGLVQPNQTVLPNIVYHGTIYAHLKSIQTKVVIDRFDAKHRLDFGKGFYTTTNLEQANKRAWDLQEQYRDPRNGQLNKLHRGIVIAFDLNQEILYSIPEEEYRVFDASDELWAEFIAANRVDRRGVVYSHPYKWTYGPMADGRTVRLCQAYFENKIGIHELMYGYEDSYTKQQLRGIKPFQDDSDQLVFHDDRTVNSMITMARIAQYAQNPLSISQTRR